MKIAATMVVRDGADILPFVVRHHLAHGVDSFHVVDHASVDGTSPLLAHLAATGLPIAWRRADGPFEQLELATELATEAKDAGASWVVTVDGDEFWNVPGGLKGFLERHRDVDGVSFPLVNFVQWRHARESGPASLGTMVARPASPVTKQAYGRLAPQSRPAWVVRQPARKVIARAGVLLGASAHHPVDPDAVVETSPQGACLHAPIRSRASVALKGPFQAMSPAERGAVWLDNTWVVPTRIGTSSAAATLALDLRLARIWRRHVAAARRDLRAIGGPASSTARP